MSRALLRLAAAVALIQGLLHGSLVIADRPIPGGEAIFESMRAQFLFHGSTRSYWGFLFGYGLMAAYNCFIESALLFFAPDKRVAAVLLAANLGYAFLVWKYFFPLPLYCDLILIALLSGALLSGNAGRADRAGAHAGKGAGRGAAGEAAR